MKCAVCGGEMRLIKIEKIEPHDEAAERGFAYRTFRCETCSDTERRFVFDPREALDFSSIGMSG
jgi:hypothetical protein